MVFITIQGKDISGKHDSALNGEIVSGTVQENHIRDIFKFISQHQIRTNKEDVYTEIGNKFFCTLLNRERDHAGRMRRALMLGDKGESEENIRKTLSVMNLSYGEFQAAREAYFNPPKKETLAENSKRFYIVMGTAIAILLIIAIFK